MDAVDPWSCLRGLSIVRIYYTGAYNITLRFKRPYISNLCPADIKIHDGVVNKSALNSVGPGFKSPTIKPATLTRCS
jgi:hypothetical protein